MCIVKDSKSINVKKLCENEILKFELGLVFMKYHDLLDSNYFSNNDFQLPHEENFVPVYKCKLCKLKLLNPENHSCFQKLHLQKYVCLCGKKFKTLKMFFKHDCDFKDEFLKCLECQSVFKTMKSLQSHKKEIHCNIKRWQCIFCGTKFSRAFDCKRHIILIHNVPFDFISNYDFVNAGNFLDWFCKNLIY